MAPKLSSLSDCFRHLMVIDNHGTPEFYLLTDGAFNRWDGDPNTMFGWLASVKSRPGQRRFGNFSDLLKHVNENNLTIYNVSYSSPAY